MSDLGSLESLSMSFPKWMAQTPVDRDSGGGGGERGVVWVLFM